MKPPKHRGSTVGAILPWKDLQTQPKPILFRDRGEKKNRAQVIWCIDGATPKHIIGQMARPQKVRAMNRHALGGCQIAEGPRHLYAHFGRGRSHLLSNRCILFSHIHDINSRCRVFLYPFISRVRQVEIRLRCSLRWLWNYKHWNKLVQPCSTRPLA